MPEAKKVQELLTLIPNTFSTKEFLDYEDLNNNLWLCRDWHKIAQNFRWQGLAKEPSEAFQIIPVAYRSRHYHGRKSNKVSKPCYKIHD